MKKIGGLALQLVFLLSPEGAVIGLCGLCSPRTCFPVWSTDTTRRDLIATPASYPKKSLSFSWGNGDPAVNLPVSIAGQTSRCMGGQSLAQCHQSLDVQPQAFGSHGHLNCNSNATWSSPLARTSHMRLQGPQRKPGSARDSTVKNFERSIYLT